MGKTKQKRGVISWLYPFLLGILIFNLMRVVTDFAKDDIFWKGEVIGQVKAIFVMTCCCYLIDIVWRYQLNKNAHIIGKETALREYITVFFQLVIFFNLLIFIGDQVVLWYVAFIDYILINIVTIPFFTLYYTLIRSDIMNKNYAAQRLQLEEIKSKQFETELDYLKAQYHPHFLFNALNTIYFQIDENNKAAKNTVELLSELLRYQLYEVNKFVTIGLEIDFINRYIEFQKQRISSRLKLNIVTDPLLQQQCIHPLLFHPLIENALKYVAGNYQIDINIKLTGNKIDFVIENSISDLNELHQTKNSGIGIENLKRRLALLYPNKHTLTIVKKENLFCAQLIIELKDEKN